MAKFEKNLPRKEIVNTEPTSMVKSQHISFNKSLETTKISERREEEEEGVKRYKPGVGVAMRAKERDLKEK